MRFRSLLPTCVYISAHQLVPARPRHSFRFCATLQTVRSSARTRGYTQNDTFPMQYDAGSACTDPKGAVMERILGVNLSGWFIPEPWVTPSLYAATGASNAAELQEGHGHHCL